MRRLLAAVVALLLLVGCQPRITDAFNERFGYVGVDVSLNVNGEGYVVFTLAHSGVDLFDPAIAIRGDGVRFNSDDCEPVEGGIDCTPGEAVMVDGEPFNVLSGDVGVYTLYLLGENILANVSYYVHDGVEVGARPYVNQSTINRE